MKANLIRVGNSMGIRLPKPIIEQCGFGKEVDLEVRGGRLIVSSAHASRQGWDEAFAAMAGKGDDRLLDPPAPTDWDEKEWRW